MLKTTSESSILESDVCKYKSGLLKTTVTSYLKAYKTNNISEIRSNSASITNTYNCLFVKEFNVSRLALWTRWSVFIIAAVPITKAIISAFQAIGSVKTK
jgi:hypothetical protein